MMENIHNSEYEVIRHDKLRHLHIFLVSILYRNMHEHSDFELDVLLKGSARIRGKNGEFRAEPGEVLLFSPYEPHELAAEAGEPLLILSMPISNHFCKEYFPRLHNVEFGTNKLSEVLPEKDLHEIRKMIFGFARVYFREEPTFQYHCVSIGSQLLARLIENVPNQTIEDQGYTARKRKTARIRRITAYIDQHYKERIMLPDLAEMEGITPTYLSHFFHDTFHMSFQDYLNRLRLEKALILMKDPNLYLVDICMECGFSDNKYLNRMFMKKFGCSAQQYRKKCTEPVPDTGGTPVPASFSEYVYPQKDSLAALENLAAAFEK